MYHEKWIVRNITKNWMWYTLNYSYTGLWNENAIIVKQNNTMENPLWHWKEAEATTIGLYLSQWVLTFMWNLH